MALLVACVALGACGAPELRRQPAARSASGVTFLVTSEFGSESDWVLAHVQASADALVRLMDDPAVEPPRLVAITLEQDPDAEYLGGWSTPTAVGFVSDQWPKEAQRLWILTHELVNLFAAHYAGSGGFPSDWWSNGRSPFPVYVVGLVFGELGLTAEADWLRSTVADQRDHELYWALHERFGFTPFARMLTMVRADRLDLGVIEPPWPHGSATRTAYTIAYLSLAAGENLTATVLAHGIGARPDGWGEIHPDMPFEEYTVEVAEVDGIMRARQALFGADAPEVARALFRRGRWQDALAARHAAAGTRTPWQVTRGARGGPAVMQ